MNISEIRAMPRPASNLACPVFWFIGQFCRLLLVSQMSQALAFVTASVLGVLLALVLVLVAMPCFGARLLLSRLKNSTFKEYALLLSVIFAVCLSVLFYSVTTRCMSHAFLISSIERYSKVPRNMLRSDQLFCPTVYEYIDDKGESRCARYVGNPFLDGKVSGCLGG